MCIANGGVYVKLGQHLAQLDYIVPEPYTRTLAALFEHNAPSPFASISALVEEELGASIGSLFDGFEATPLASASLAQVHVAYEHGTGRKLAVKVQHPRLREASKADLAAVALAVSAAQWLFQDDFRLGWVLEELAPHLPLELDFEHEAANLERCRAFFAPGGDGAALCDSIVLPTVCYPLSSKRVLTMSFEEGARITDADALHEMGVAPSAVTRLLSECFCSLVFRGRFVHCDPHPGNVLVRRRRGRQAKGGAISLVLLDHGLYRELPSRFTLLYAQLWQSVLLGDADGIRTTAFELGVGEYYPLLAAMLTGRPWGDILRTAGDAGGDPRRLREKGTAEDKAQIRGYAQQYLKQIVKIMELVPAPMLLIFKTNDCLRHVERQLLGEASGGESFVIMLRHCVHALLVERTGRTNGFVMWLLQLCLDGAQGLGMGAVGFFSRALAATG